MELTERVYEAVMQLVGVSISHELFENDQGKKFTKFNINSGGSVHQFVAPYPSLDEDYNNTFVKKVMKEI